VGGINASTTFGGTAPLKIWEGKKRAKIGAIYNNLINYSSVTALPVATFADLHIRNKHLEISVKVATGNAVI